MVSPHFSLGHADHRDLGDGRVREEHVLDLDRGDVLAAGDDDVLLAVADREVAVVADHAAVAGVEPAVDERLLASPRAAPSSPRGSRWSAPAPRRLGRRCCRRTPIAGAPARTSLARALLGRQVVPLGAAAVDGQQRRGLGEAVDLDELPAELLLDPHDGLRRRRRAGDDDPHRGRDRGSRPPSPGRPRAPRRRRPAPRT